MQNSIKKGLKIKKSILLCSNFMGQRLQDLFSSNFIRKLLNSQKFSTKQEFFSQLTGYTITRARECIRSKEPKYRALGLYIAITGSLFFLFFLKTLLIHERQRDRQRQRQREKQAPHREPNVGLDPRIPGSQPKPKADAQGLSHPGAHEIFFRDLFIYFIQRDRQRDREHGGQGISEPKTGLNLTTPRSQPELKSKVGCLID